MAKDKDFNTLIGLEIHLELKTKTKMFCRCLNEDWAEPNKNICPICLGYPGVLPVPNKKAILYTLKLGLALNCKIAKESKFDRKHYFYPDLPKNYQISQYDMPFTSQGKMELNIGSSESNRREKGVKTIRINRVHLEEDAAKLIHPEGVNYSLVDFNRSGVPLVEVVTEPDISTGEEAKMYLKLLQLISRYLNISNADMEKGQMRCDANISVKKGNETTPVFEIKNMNSFRAVQRALEYEERRLKENFDELKKQKGKRTLTWIETQGKTKEMRFKEEASDYRYFPEPDISVFRPHKLFDLRKIRKELPEMPQQRLHKLIDEFGLSNKEALILTERPSWYKYFLKVAEPSSFKETADWMINENLGTSLDYKVLKFITKGIIDKKLSRPFVKQTILPGVRQGKNIKKLLELSYKQSFDLNEICKRIIKENRDAVENYKKGKVNALQFLIGQVMRETKGRAEPIEVAQKIKDLIK